MAVLIALPLTLACALIATPVNAGQPYETDDPEPVACHHLEVDLAYSRQGPSPSTMPSIEIDYGPTRRVEVSIAAQPGETELGSAILLVTETKSRPEVGFLPAIAFKQDGGSEAFFPVWLQKSVGKWTVFGGSGISRSFVSSGVALQYNQSSRSSFGAEFFTDNPRTPTQRSQPRFNLGYTGQLADGRAIMLSAGRNLGPGAAYTFYAGYQMIVGPRGHAPNCRG